MTKYQLDHFKSKVRRNFEPLIREQELLVKQYKTEATNKIVGKLAKKMGADKILDQLKKAEAHLKKAQDSAKTFFKKKATKEKKSSFGSGTIWKYAQTVGPAYLGAPTHPGKKKEVKEYSKI